MASSKGALGTMATFHVPVYLAKKRACRLLHPTCRKFGDSHLDMEWGGGNKKDVEGRWCLGKTGSESWIILKKPPPSERTGPGEGNPSLSSNGIRK